MWPCEIFTIEKQKKKQKNKLHKHLEMLRFQFLWNLPSLEMQISSAGDWVYDFVFIKFFIKC